MKTGPHSFTDATGVEWIIEGYSRACGPAYADCRAADGGDAITVRPIAYLASAGLSLPPDAAPPTRKATSAEKKSALKLAEQMPVPPSEDVTDATSTTSDGMSAQVGASSDDVHERNCGCVRCYTGRMQYPADAEEALTPLRVAAEHVGVPVAIPRPSFIPAPHPVGCECGNCVHRQYGCIVCGDAAFHCTPTHCNGSGPDPLALLGPATIECLHTDVTEAADPRDDFAQLRYWRCRDCGSMFPLIGDTDEWRPGAKSADGAQVIEMPPRYGDATEAWAMHDPALAGLVEIAPGEWGFPEHE